MQSVFTAQMLRPFLFILLVFSLSSCGYKTQEWLEDYSRIKCAYIIKVSQRDSALTASTKDLENQKLQAETNFKEAGKDFTDKISMLQQKIKKAQDDYMTQYRAARDAHEAVYGHVSTPDYDQKIGKLAQHRDALIAGYNNEIENIRKEQNADANYINAKNKVIAIDTSIAQAERVVKKQFQPSIDSLQSLLNMQNSLFKEISTGMKSGELKRFTTQRDSLKENPCKK